MENAIRLRSRQTRLVHTRVAPDDLDTLRSAARRADAPMAELLRVGGLRVAHEILSAPAPSIPRGASK